MLKILIKEVSTTVTQISEKTSKRMSLPLPLIAEISESIS
jgi:hypothetical protein